MSLNSFIPESELVDIAADHNIPVSNYYTRWHELAKWQIDILKKYGMESRHRLLDVGCGALRLGHVAIPYLDDGHYCGIDVDQSHMKVGEAILERLGVNKRYQLAVSDGFDFEQFGMRFDYAMAQSVITHLSITQTELLMRRLASVMAPDGIFIFTYLEKSKQPTAGFLYRGIIPMKRGAFPGPDVFIRLGREVKTEFTALPDRHESQLAGMFRFPSA